MAKRLAEDLRAAGIDVWYAEWELKPGDSLRRRVEEGIGRASHFLVLLSEASLKSEWVQTELDAGMVRRIEGSCRLIPVLHGIADRQVPLTLRGIVWVRTEPYELELRKLINICHEVDSKPPLGTAPKWTQEKPLEDLGLSVHAQRVAGLLNYRSELGLEFEPRLAPYEIESTLGINENELALAADELEEQGWVHLNKTLNSGPAGFTTISPMYNLFFNTDLPLRGWDTEEDARVLAATAVNAKKDSVTLIELDQLLSWGPRRINPAAAYLRLYQYVQASDSLRTDPYVYHWFYIAAKTRRFASEK